MIRILVADDHPIVCAGLKQILEEAQDIIVADDASDGNEVWDKIAKNNYDVVVLDISMPGRSGLDILKQLKVQKPQLPVLILSIYPEEQYAVRALKAGAAGYLTKNAAAEELIGAIRKVAVGRKYVSPTLAENLVVALDQDSDKPPQENLSDREYQVMCMIAQGKTVSEIAKELFISVKTVSTYRLRILQKMNMKSNAELTRYVIENGLTQ